MPRPARGTKHTELLPRQNGDICRLFDIFETRLDLDDPDGTSFDNLYAGYAGLLESEKFAVVSREKFGRELSKRPKKFRKFRRDGKIHYNVALPRL